MYKLILTDMDGTFLNSEHVISYENIQAVKKAQENGVKFAIVSGRPYNMIKPFVTEHGFNCYAASLNGAQIFDENHNVICEDYVDHGSVGEIMKVCEEEGIIYNIYTSDSVITKIIDNAEEELIEIAKLIAGENEQLSKAVEAMKKFMYMDCLALKDVWGYITKHELRVYKIEAHSSKKTVLDRIKKKLSKISDINITSSFRDNLEITNVNVHKGEALKKLAEKLGVCKREIIALGDNLNDLEMIKAAGMGIAMGNALEEVKKEADFVTSTNDEHGVAYAIDKFIFNISKNMAG